VARKVRAGAGRVVVKLMTVRALERAAGNQLLPLLDQRGVARLELLLRGQLRLGAERGNDLLELRLLIVGVGRHLFEDVAHHAAFASAFLGVREGGTAKIGQRFDLLWVHETTQPRPRAEAGEVRRGLRFGQRRAETIVPLVGVAARALTRKKPRTLRKRIIG